MGDSRSILLLTLHAGEASCLTKEHRENHTAGRRGGGDLGGRALAALLDKNGWKAAAFIAVSVKPGSAGPKSVTSDRSSFTAFTKQLNAKGWSKNIITRHYEAWEAAAEDGLVPHAADLVYGERIEVPIDGMGRYYPPRWSAMSRPNWSRRKPRPTGRRVQGGRHRQEPEGDGGSDQGQPEGGGGRGTGVGRDR